MTHFKPKIITGFAAISLAWILAACAGGSRVTPEAAPRAEVEQIADGVTPEVFTTVGKPTKTIETPRGTIEIYDPLKDSEVRSQFSQYMKSDYELLSPSQKYLWNVRGGLTQEYRKNYCSIITDGSCKIWNYRGCEGPPPYSCIMLPPLAGETLTCDLNNYRHDVRDFKSLKNLDDAMTKYFELECNQWKE